jgi:hypothetical protein
MQEIARARLGKGILRFLLRLLTGPQSNEDSMSGFGLFM